MIAQNSFRFIAIPFLIGITIMLIPTSGWGMYIKYIFSLLFFIFSLYMIWFFRDPKREIVINDRHILAAADGIIIYVREDNNILEIATRMSPFNVHLNRSPIAGVIRSIKHSPGSHRSVYFAGAEEKNERNLVEIENDTIKCEVLQLTGAFARRIEVWNKVNDSVEQGAKFGMIRFGSQTNIRIRLEDDKNSFYPIVKIGDKVRAGLTVVAELREK